MKNKVTQSNFDCAAFLANAGLGRRIVQLQPKDTFFFREIRPTPSSISRQDGQNSQ